MEFDEMLENEKEVQLREELELPDQVELLEREASTEISSQIRQTTSEMTDGLEVDERSRESVESPEVPSYEYSEAYVDKNGMYHPSQIQGVYKDALEENDCREVASELGNWGMQEKQLSCAVRAQMMIGNENPDIQYTEGELREIAERNKWYSDDIGTYISNIGKVAELCYDMEREQYKYLEMDALEDLKTQGAELIVTVDHALLAYPDLPKPTTPDHVVEVIGFDHSRKGEPMVIINDPGRSDGRGAAYSYEMFQRAAYVTDKETGQTGIRSVTALYQGGQG